MLQAHAKKSEMKLIEIKYKKANQPMPWYWMALLSSACPGQFYRTDKNGSYIIFSGRGLPKETNKILQFLGNHSSVSGCLGPKLTGVRTVDSVPTDAIPLFNELYQQAVQTMKNATGNSINAARAVENIMQCRCQSLLRSYSAQNAFGNESVFILEKTASQYLRMGNTVKHGDIGRATNYVSRVLLSDTTTTQSLAIPDNTKNATFQIFILDEKQPQISSCFTNKKNAEKLTALISQHLGFAAHVILDASSLNIVITNSPVVGEQNRSIFLEKIRTTFYESALDKNYQLIWSKSSHDFKLDIDSGNETDDEEENNLINTSTKIISRSPDVDNKLLANSWKRNAPRKRILFVSKMFADSAKKLNIELNKKGFSAIRGEVDSKNDAVEVTLRGKGI